MTILRCEIIGSARSRDTVSRICDYFEAKTPSGTLDLPTPRARGVRGVRTVWSVYFPSGREMNDITFYHTKGFIEGWITAEENKEEEPNHAKA